LNKSQARLANCLGLPFDMMAISVQNV